MAAQYSKSETVVKAMIEMYPDALTIQNNVCRHFPSSIVTPVLASDPYSPALQHVSAQEGKTPGEIAEELNPDIAELFK